jgi:hypothetical protein
MNDPAKSLYRSRGTEGLWFLFDCRGPGAKNRLHRERRAWGARATVESLGSGRVVLVVRSGGALELAR